MGEIDYAAIEARVIAHMLGSEAEAQGRLDKIKQDAPDIAAAWEKVKRQIGGTIGVPKKMLDGDRSNFSARGLGQALGRNVNFGMLYGMGKKGLKQMTADYLKREAEWEHVWGGEIDGMLVRDRKSGRIGVVAKRTKIMGVTRGAFLNWLDGNIGSAPWSELEPADIVQALATLDGDEE